MQWFKAEVIDSLVKVLPFVSPLIPTAYLHLKPFRINVFNLLIVADLDSCRDLCYVNGSGNDEVCFS